MHELKCLLILYLPGIQSSRESFLYKILEINALIIGAVVLLSDKDLSYNMSLWVRPWWVMM